MIGLSVKETFFASSNVHRTSEKVLQQVEDKHFLKWL